MYEARTQKVQTREIHLGVTVTWMGDEGMGVAWEKVQALGNTKI